MMEFHISRAVREATQVDDLLFSYSGNVVFANVTAARKLAEALNKSRGPNADPAGAYNAGALFAMGLIDELSHALVARYRKEIDPAVLSDAVRWFTAQIEPAKLEKLLLEFTSQFPNVAVFRGQVTAADWLRSATEGVPNREVALEELLMLWIANLNPAFKPFQTLFEDTTLRHQTVYSNVTAAFPGYFSTRPPVPQIGTLFEALRAPMLASPDSLTGQLDFIREKWAPYLGEDLKRILLAIDVLREEDLAIWMRFHPPGPDEFRHGAPTWGSMGFVGDEFIGYDEFKRRKYAAGYQAPLDEYENFSADQAWMPNVVLMAKSTYVWLEQLSKKYLRHIHRLDQIPDEELHLLAHRGITGLWLIGLWERSVASQTIKRLRGHHDAVASAYSLKSYDIAADLGGWSAYENLKHRAGVAGLRLASDMVPNHMGIDSPWVIEHPDWFVNRYESPFPAYSFNGPDLSTDSRVEIKIDDHYYDQTDAAVAFRLRQHNSGETRYIYHGNDGTTFAWNDTAQLDYSKAYVREHVIQTILHVARLFPIIRFDAAMVLAKRHVQRLWFPLPGAGGSIPSRAENSMSQDEFDALMPHEFWREVVDRVAAEVPGTLLLAEAFWLLEGYFVRTLGMHRVYNSAFMNMLRDEENAKYRSYIKKTLEFDPDIMKRYVNFMSNPDERTAIDQFGSGDKYFGVCTLLATLPGLPMFGHGQIDGFGERYGMEFKTAKMDERPNEDLVARHQREIAPLLKKRYIFAGSSNFTLYDFWNGYGHVDENVFAYSNRCDGERSLVLYNNKYDATSGTIHISSGFMDKGSGQMRQRSLADGLGLPTNESLIIRYRDTNGLEYLRRATDIHWHGLTFELRGFQCVCLLDWHELRSTAEYPWEWLCDTLRGTGVPNLDQELTRLRLGPLHNTLHQAIGSDTIQVLAAIACEREPACRAALASPTPTDAKSSVAEDPADPRLNPLIEKSQLFFDRLHENIPEDLRASLKPSTPLSAATSKFPAAPTYAESVSELAYASTLIPFLAQSFSTDFPDEARRMLPGRKPGTQTDQAWAPVLAWIVLRSLPFHGNLLQVFDRLELRSALADAFAAFGMEGEAKWRAAAQVRMLLSAQAASVRSEKFWSDPDARWLAGVNTSAGVTYINREQFEELLAWLQLPALIKIAQQKTGQAKAIAELEAAFAATCEAAHAAGYQLQAFLTLAKPQPQTSSLIAQSS
ncbi:MAG: alpha-amylase family glycosyl hydrolase [Acidobacteriota bacterium]|nr:alpha-amylase family glycosyl hydrolase [Acidobacteriota bacterium]